MDRRERILAGLDLARSRGVEIGALTTPLVRREDGPIRYVDHADTRTLRRKYAGDPLVDIDRIVEVDAVWGDSTLLEALGGEGADYVVASHLIEHVPDLLGWLEEVRAVLRPGTKAAGEGTEAGGTLRLVVPDRRFTFDRLRPESTLADLLYARLRRARVPQAPAILGHVLEVVALDLEAAWAGRVDPDALRRLHDTPHALAVARDMLEHGTYHDVHCWVFTPRSLGRLFARAAAEGLIRFRCVAAHDTAPGELDFILHLAPCDDPAVAARSWREMAESRADLPPDPLASGPFADGHPAPAERDALRAELRRLRGEAGALSARLAVAEAEAGAARQALEVMRASTVWRLSGPLRRTVDRLRGH